MTVDLLTTSHYDQLTPAVRRILLDVYADVYADEITTNPFFSLERFEERLGMHAVTGWGCVVAEVGDVVAGFTYGRPERDTTTFGLCEIMLRQEWRGRGIAQVMHSELMSQRNEDRCKLLVRRERPRIRAHYESWGYKHAGEKLPFPDSPLYDVMILDLQ
ncbi:GNAT family N-acetyltransferase [Streptomyces corynorhini]|uniref:N-acetyltransferase n=1 Tax=Streptomyces corynorhini TaxID=2282652 RepID=A0A370B6H6_9ACTN|nr:GNAT family N-acetyltransferase [Streptomyces corynorhini]RDG35684.1 N-acetyltransferase [Streptomyces corynorhini]